MASSPSKAPAPYRASPGTHLCFHVCHYCSPHQPRLCPCVCGGIMGAYSRHTQHSLSLGKVTLSSVKLVTDCSFFLLDNSFPDGFFDYPAHQSACFLPLVPPCVFLPAIQACPDWTQTQMDSEDRWLETDEAGRVFAYKPTEVVITRFFFSLKPEAFSM